MGDILPKVNLDALILREDFRASTQNPESSAVLAAELALKTLADETIRGLLRKPDFQRETADWTPEQVAELVQSFLEGDLIPSVILWRSPENGNIFVIDGAHRLSALIAWVNDDYGDGHHSIRFFEGVIPDEQKKAAEQTRKLINQNIGSYQSLELALRHHDTADSEQVRLARNMSIFSVKAQWVQGEAEKAESSFFRINQKATQIDPTELEIIQARRNPNALAARAIMRAGTGHKYWSAFNEETQKEIEKLGKEVHGIIDKSLHAPDLPSPGRTGSTTDIRMIFDLVNTVNKPFLKPTEGSTRKSNRKAGSTKAFEADTTGQETIRFLKSTRRSILLVHGNDPSSLGLHPGVYFYTATGNSQPSAFLATVQFVRTLRELNKLPTFTEIRREFEEFLVEYKYFLNQIVHQYGSRGRPVPAITTLYWTLFQSIQQQPNNKDAALQSILNKKEFRKLKLKDEERREYGRNFSREIKSKLKLESSLKSADRCAICLARLHINSVSIDHKIRRQDGGSGDPDNGQLTHPYCNSGYKESMTPAGI